LARGAWQQLLLPFAREEPEDTLPELFGAERTEDTFGQPDRAAQIEALVVVPVEVSLAALRVVEEAVGVELFVAVEVVARAVKILAAALGDDLDVAAGRAAVLGLISRSRSGEEEELDAAEGFERSHRRYAEQVR
jgi:hypothetical protein